MHPDEESLADLAFGEPGTVDAARHVESCTQCAALVVDLRVVEELIRSTSNEHLSEPPPDLWNRIAHATFAPDGAGVHVARAADDDTTELSGTAERRSAEDATGDASGTDGSDGTVTDISRSRRAGNGRGRRSWRPWLTGVAAAASLVLGVALGYWWPTSEGGSESIVASASLRTLDEAKQSLGEADVVRGAAGGHLLKVNTSTFERDSGGYVEVWLINADGKRMISVGTLEGAATALPIPSDALDQGYRIVDVSREQYDDKPTHSGDSVMRGNLAL